MTSEYCAQCGHKLYFESVKPKFCSKCGEPFNTYTAKVKPTASTAKVEKARKFSDDEEDEYSDFDISALNPANLGVANVETFFSRPVTIGAVAATNQDEGPILRPTFRAPEGVGSVLKLTEQECASSKNNPVELD